MIEQLLFPRESRVEVPASAVGVPRSAWICLPEHDAQLQRAHDLMRQHRIDLVPIVNARQHVREYFRAVQPNRFEEVERCLLTHHDILPLHTPIREVIKDFARENRSFFFLEYEHQLSGLLTIANLNSRPVSVYLFNLLSEAEMRLAVFLRQMMPAPEMEAYLQQKAQSSQSPEARRRMEEILQRYAEDHLSGLDNHITEYLYFSDLLNLIQQQGLYRQLHYPSRQVFERLNSLNMLRNAVAHPTRSLINPADSVQKLWSTLDLLEELLFRLRNYP